MRAVTPVTEQEMQDHARAMRDAQAPDCSLKAAATAALMLLAFLALLWLGNLLGGVLCLLLPFNPPSPCPSLSLTLPLSRWR